MCSEKCDAPSGSQDILYGRLDRATFGDFAWALVDSHCGHPRRSAWSCHLFARALQATRTPRRTVNARVAPNLMIRRVEPSSAEKEYPMNRWPLIAVFMMVSYSPMLKRSRAT